MQFEAWSGIDQALMKKGILPIRPVIGKRTIVEETKVYPLVGGVSRSTVFIFFKYDIHFVRTIIRVVQSAANNCRIACAFPRTNNFICVLG